MVLELIVNQKHLLKKLKDFLKEETMSKELIVIEELKPEIVFSKGGALSIIEGIKQRAFSVVLDVTTKSGRDDIRSLAHKIAQSKTALDDLGKVVKEEWQSKINIIDSERKTIRDSLDALKEEIRKPLTDFENKEKARVKAHEDFIASIEALEVYSKPNDSGLFYPVMDIIGAFAGIEDAISTYNGEEFTDKINYTFKAMKEKLDQAIVKRQKYDTEQEELRLLREKQIEQERIDRERLVAEKAKADAEAAAKALADKVKKEAEDREALLLKQKADAEAAAAKAIADAKKAADDARIAKEQADLKAKADAEAAAKAERDKIEAERIKLEAETKKREADEENRKRVNNEILLSLVEHCGVDNELAKKITIAMVRGDIKNVTVKY
jgi:hypothetical protein